MRSQELTMRLQPHRLVLRPYLISMRIWFKAGKPLNGAITLFFDVADRTDFF
jgi:hypothetical protein